jgi:hypothetical protein
MTDIDGFVGEPFGHGQALNRNIANMGHCP